VARGAALDFTEGERSAEAPAVVALAVRYVDASRPRLEGA